MIHGQIVRDRDDLGRGRRRHFDHGFRRADHIFRGDQVGRQGFQQLVPQALPLRAGLSIEGDRIFFLPVLRPLRSRPADEPVRVEAVDLVVDPPLVHASILSDCFHPIRHNGCLFFTFSEEEHICHNFRAGVGPKGSIREAYGGQEISARSQPFADLVLGFIQSVAGGNDRLDATRAQVGQPFRNEVIVNTSAQLLADTTVHHRCV